MHREGKLIREDAAVVAALAAGTPEWGAHFGGCAITDGPCRAFPIAEVATKHPFEDGSKPRAGGSNRPFGGASRG